MHDRANETIGPDLPSSRTVLTQAADPYTIPVLAKALDLLDLFDPSGPPMTLAEVVHRSGVAQTTVYRILHTLCSRGYLSRTGAKYRLNRLRACLRSPENQSKEGQVDHLQAGVQLAFAVLP